MKSFELENSTFTDSLKVYIVAATHRNRSSHKEGMVLLRRPILLGRESTRRHRRRKLREWSEPARDYPARATNWAPGYRYGRGV
jgi:hypothetical protein